MDYKPILRRHYTVINANHEPKFRQRTKTASLLNASKETEVEFTDLTLSSIRKKFQVSDLKPFAVDQSVIEEIKIQLQGIKEPEPQRVKTEPHEPFGNSSEFFESKIMGLVPRNTNYSPTSHKKKKRKFRNSDLLIKSQVWDDLELLMEDYKQDRNGDKLKREKTISYLNKRILAKYPQQVQKQGFVSKNKLLKFKKDPKVVQIHGESTQYRAGPAYKSGLNVRKSDYGIYSRSAKKSFYNETKSDPIGDELKANLTKKQVMMQKSFYVNYLGSYKQRKSMLRNTTNPFNI